VDVRPEAAAVDGQIDVHVIVVRGDDHGGRLPDSGLLQDLQFRGVAADQLGRIDPRARLAFHDPVVDALLVQRFGDRSPYSPAADQQDRFVRGFVDAEQFVVGIQLLARAGEDQDRGRLDQGVGPGQLKAASVPDSDDIHVGVVAQADVLQRAADQRRVQRRRLGDQDLAELADHARLGIAPQNPPRQRLAQHLGELQHLIAAGNCRMSIEAAEAAVATIATDSVISRTVNATFVLAVSVRVVTTNAA
jgi:hypothetical protein